MHNNFFFLKMFYSFSSFKKQQSYNACFDNNTISIIIMFNETRSVRVVFLQIIRGSIWIIIYLLVTLVVLCPQIDPGCGTSPIWTCLTPMGTCGALSPSETLRRACDCMLKSWRFKSHLQRWLVLDNVRYCFKLTIPVFRCYHISRDEPVSGLQSKTASPGEIRNAG